MFKWFTNLIATKIVALLVEKRQLQNLVMDAVVAVLEMDPDSELKYRSLILYGDAERRERLEALRSKLINHSRRVYSDYLQNDISAALRREYGPEINALVRNSFENHKDFLEREEFIDSVVDRIRRKQLNV